jgi:hypothetical protein
VLFGLFVPTMTMLVSCFVVVMSSGSVLCSSGKMMQDGRMFCRCHNINPLLMKPRSRNVMRLLAV